MKGLRARVGRSRKRMISLSDGVGENWIVDAGQRLIERWRPSGAEPEMAAEGLRWSPRAGIEALVLPVANYSDEIVW